MCLLADNIAKLSIFAQILEKMFSSAIRSFLLQKQYPFFHPKAVFFDMDGVLFDSMKFHASSWVKAMNAVNIPFTKYEAYMNEGRTGHSTIDDVYHRLLGRGASEEEKRKIYSLKSAYFEACGPTPKMAYAQELLDKIKTKGYDIFLVTGSGQPTLINSLQEHFPGVFQKEKMVTAFDVKHGKPAPEPYLKALQKSGVCPWEVVVIENAPLGVEASVAAGLFTIAVNTGPLEPEVLAKNGANVVLDSMEQLFREWEPFEDSWK